MSVDLWVNGMPRRTFMVQPGEDDEPASRIRAILGSMDRAGVDLSVVMTRLSAGEGHRDILSVEELLAATEAHESRIWVSAYVDRPDRVSRQAARVRELGRHERFKMLRIIPALSQTPLDDRRFYPAYAACEELDIPVSVTVGLGPSGTGWACQHPDRLESLLVDFPDLRVVASHVGPPFESHLVALAERWPRLHLSNSAHRADRMHADLRALLVRRPGRVLFASDHPLLDMTVAHDAARRLEVAPEALDSYLTAARTLLAR